MSFVIKNCLILFRNFVNKLDEKNSIKYLVH